jgi:CBS domain-containing protein
MKAKEIMTRDVIAVRPAATVEEIAQLLSKHRIGGVPVVDDERHVVGIVTERDLFLDENGLPFSAVEPPVSFMDRTDPGTRENSGAGLLRRTASEIMTPDPICVSPEEDVRLVSRKMAQGGLMRVPVVEDGLLVGIISDADLIWMLAQEHDDTPYVSHFDPGRSRSLALELVCLALCSGDYEISFVGSAKETVAMRTKSEGRIIQ